ncbi:hypothetical protein [Sulfitobacter sp. PS-8MA]|uniref:hypothetical protein n=1 Tax=Sulfitobacter sp. PS-8MA TaxID=3237707 RepID=UPI0034C5F8F5
MQVHAPVDIYLEAPLRESAEAGAHNFIAKMTQALENARFRVAYRDIDGPVQDRGALSLSHMAPAPTARGLLFRRCYHYPFWQIEARPERWLWDVAQAQFDPAQVQAKAAAQFYRFWQKRLFGDAPRQARHDGPIYVALQGRLLQRRSFQTCSPIEMLAHTLGHGGKPVVAALHPKEDYSAPELAALERLAARHPALQLTTGGMEQHLASCAYMVTMNSAAAFSGYFFGKPALFFGEIDFHHIGVKADLSDLAGSFAAVAEARPDYAAYLYWFWQENCINAGRPEAEERIAARLRRFGWPV